ncbi:MAG: hypothetical protein ACLULK_09115, partial [Anaerovoracaceae bacterium]
EISFYEISVYFKESTLRSVPHLACDRCAKEALIPSCTLFYRAGSIIISSDVDFRFAGYEKYPKVKFICVFWIKRPLFYCLA